MAKKRAQSRNDMHWLIERARQYGVSLDLIVPLWEDFLDFVFPELNRSTDTERQSAAERILAWIDGLEPETVVTAKQGRAKAGLKEDSLSDLIWTRKYMQSSAVGLEFSGRTSEIFMKPRLTNGGAGGANTDTPPTK